MSETQYGKHFVLIPLVPMTGKGNGTEICDMWGKALGGFEVNIAIRAFNEVARINSEYQPRPTRTVSMKS